MKRVVITGMGAVTPLGNTLADSWEALSAGKSGLGPITRFDASGLNWKSAGELKGFNPSDYISKKDTNRLDPFIHYAAAAASMAIEDAGLRELAGSGIIIGSSRGGISTIEESLNTRLSAFLMPGTTVSMAASYVASIFDIKGHVLGISNACSSGSNAIGEAFRMIKYGLADTMIAGGAEAPVCGLCVKGYGASGALSKTGISRPFDRKRDGFVLSEGAAVLVLEEYQKAIQRGAMIYGEITGYGNMADAFHQTMPDKEGQVRAIRAALAEASAEASDVDLINAHATSTPIGDASEAGAIESVFGRNRIVVSADKSMTGHMLGASGALEAAFTLKGISDGILAPVINVDESEFGLNLNFSPKKTEINVAVSNSFGFGGVNSVLIFKSLR
jgi:3-oxoacyl-[acyl-carrier-protein] synthase II